MELQQIKHLYAKERMYENYLDMVSDMTDVEVDIATDKISRLFAKAKLDKLIENLPTDRDIERRGRDGGQDMRRIIKEKINNIKLD